MNTIEASNRQHAGSLFESRGRIIVDAAAFETPASFEALKSIIGDFDPDVIAGIKLSDRHPEVVHEVCELFIDQSTKIPFFIDDAVTGGFEASVDEMKTVNRKFGFNSVVFSLGRSMTNLFVATIDEGLNPTGTPTDQCTQFVLSTYLPEELHNLRDPYVDVGPEEHARRTAMQAKELGGNVIGVYGAASLATSDNRLAIGTGISFDGSIQLNKGVRKPSTRVEAALETCEKILVGRLLLAGVQSTDPENDTLRTIAKNFERLVLITSAS